MLCRLWPKKKCQNISTPWLNNWAEPSKFEVKISADFQIPSLIVQRSCNVAARMETPQVLMKRRSG
jgi:hypothetical protein